MAKDPAPLNEYDADEWFDVCRQIRPDYSREQFDRDWETFQERKREHLRDKALN